MPIVPPPEKCETRTALYKSLSEDCSLSKAVRESNVGRTDAQTGYCECRPVIENMFSRRTKAAPIFQQWIKFIHGDGLLVLQKSWCLIELQKTMLDRITHY